MERSTAQERIGLENDFGGSIEAFRRALETYVKGDANPVIGFFSRQDDVTIANPLGPPRRGPKDVREAIAAGAAQLSDGSIRSFEEVIRYRSGDLGYVVQIERAQARLAGGENVSPIALRVTMIFRREDDTWRIVHRHADPITSPRSITTTIES